MRAHTHAHTHDSQHAMRLLACYTVQYYRSVLFLFLFLFFFFFIAIFWVVSFFVDATPFMILACHPAEGFGSLLLLANEGFVASFNAFSMLSFGLVAAIT